MGIAKHNLLPNGTKEDILNLMAQGPKTISQVADALGLSAPTVYAHVRDLLGSELLREAVGWEKTHPAERFYEPNFPVVKEEEASELCGLCDVLAGQVASLFKQHRRHFEKAFRETQLAERGWDFPDVAHYVYMRVQRGARARLEQEGALISPRPHRNGVEWVFWAEERNASPTP